MASRAASLLNAFLQLQTAEDRPLPARQRSFSACGGKPGERARNRSLTVCVSRRTAKNKTKKETPRNCRARSRSVARQPNPLDFSIQHPATPGQACRRLTDALQKSLDNIPWKTAAREDIVIFVAGCHHTLTTLLRLLEGENEEVSASSFSKNQALLETLLRTCHRTVAPCLTATVNAYQECLRRHHGDDASIYPKLFWNYQPRCCETLAASCYYHTEGFLALSRSLNLFVACLGYLLESEHPILNHSGSGSASRVVFVYHCQGIFEILRLLVSVCFAGLEQFPPSSAVGGKSWDATWHDMRQGFSAFKASRSCAESLPRGRPALKSKFSRRTIRSPTLQRKFIRMNEILV